MRTLIVDDNALTRYTIKSMLEKLGHEVAGEAENYDEAVQLFTEKKPDVVFLDLILPGKSGIEVLTKLRSLSAASKIVVLTAVSQAEVDKDIMEKGACAVMYKPFSYEDFKKLLKDVSCKSA